MLNLLVAPVSLVSVIAAVLGPVAQTPRPEAVDLKPITVAVVDRDSGAPVTEFTYQAWYDAPGRPDLPNGDAWTSAKSPAGTFEIQAPAACQLSVAAKAPDYIGGYPGLTRFVIKSTDHPRRVVVKLRRGITVRGTVRDSRTNDPIAGATVAPVIHMLPIWVPDDDKRVETGADGRYTVRGVDPVLGVAASHPGYIHDLAFPDGEKTGPIHDIFLKPGLTVAATVVDSQKRPLKGVTAADLGNKRAMSGADGKLLLQNPDLVLGLTFHKDGFIDRKLERDKIRRELSEAGRLVVVMVPTIALTGRVVGPDDRPVAAFTVAAGPGKLPPWSRTVQSAVRDPEGRFSLGLSNEGTNWIGVGASGFAAWEGWVEVKRGGEPLVIRLSAGVTVSATVVAPEPLAKMAKARLDLRRDKSDIGGIPSYPLAEAFATRTATRAADGTFRFEHVRPDRYRLFVDAPRITPTVLAVDVPAAGLNIGTVPLKVPTATGRIEGRVWHPKSRGGVPWAFAKGYVGGFVFEGVRDDNESSIEFQADENGRFKVESVPVGLTTVGFPVQVFDVVNSYRWSVLVVEGKTTMVQAFDPDRRSQFTLAFAIGDGSRGQYQSGTGLSAARKVENVTFDSRVGPMLRRLGMGQRDPMFRIELIPIPKGPLAFAEPDWCKLDARAKIVLPEVGAGTYRVRVYDWLGLVGLDSKPLFDREVVVPPGGGGEVSIALGAGCITGKIPAIKENFERPVEVTAVANGNHGLTRQARCDDDGNFCVRYLSPGTYSVFIHDPNSGYCLVDHIEVQPGAVDIGERTLSAGATISGEIRFERPTRVPSEVVAVDSSGVSVRQVFPVYSSFDHVQLTALWPGHWTVSARDGDEVLATGEVDVTGTGTFNVVLAAGALKGP